MGKGIAETFEQRMTEWEKRKAELNAQKPSLPSLRLNNNVLANLTNEGILLNVTDIHDRREDYALDLDRREAIDLANFIIELFGDQPATTPSISGSVDDFKII